MTKEERALFEAVMLYLGTPLIDAFEKAAEAGVGPADEKWMKLIAEDEECEEQELRALLTPPADLGLRAAALRLAAAILAAGDDAQ